MTLVFLSYTAPLSAAAPTKPPPHQTSASTTSGAPNNGKNSGLVLVLGIGAGILIVAVIFVLVMCSCSSRKKPKPSLKDSGMTCVYHVQHYLYVHQQQFPYSYLLRSFIVL